MGNIFTRTGHKEFFKDGFEPDVVITAGGTREDIDDVRYIGNFSGGRLGAALADAYYEQGRKVLFLATKEAGEKLRWDPTEYRSWNYDCTEMPDDEIEAMKQREMDFYELDRSSVMTRIPRDPPHLETRTFKTAADLRRELLAISSARLVLHAAAVADYTPLKAEGKISSDQDELTLTLTRTPKILAELRDHFGEDTTIVGFKLLSNVSEKQLISTALKQIADNSTDYCIANDLQEVNTQGSGRFGKGKERRVHIVHADGSFETEEGLTMGIARSIASKLAPAERGVVRA